MFRLTPIPNVAVRYAQLTVFPVSLGSGSRTNVLPDAFIEAMCNSMHESHNQASIDFTPQQKVEMTRAPF